MDNQRPQRRRQLRPPHNLYQNDNRDYSEHAHDSRHTGDVVHGNVVRGDQVHGDQSKNNYDADSQSISNFQRANVYGHGNGSHGNNPQPPQNAPAAAPAPAPAPGPPPQAAPAPAAGPAARDQPRPVLAPAQQQAQGQRAGQGQSEVEWEESVPDNESPPVSPAPVGTMELDEDELDVNRDVEYKESESSTTVGCDNDNVSKEWMGKKVIEGLYMVSNQKEAKQILHECENYCDAMDIIPIVDGGLYHYGTQMHASYFKKQIIEKYWTSSCWKDTIEAFRRSLAETSDVNMGGQE